ncbi:MAG: hypothetical protein HQ453_02925 [Actinobacteria bacterium]|jgi:hypothetical protein|nr:hypothetical protein [Actinomycetota bacterium]
MVSVGFTVEQIREFVHEYELQPHGGKTVWLAAQGVSYGRLARWRTLVFEGDLNHGLIPRQGVPMTIHQGGRRSLERQRARERAAQEAEVARLAARVKELEAVNESLGKAIGLLHQMSEQEPDEIPTPSDPTAS